TDGSHTFQVRAIDFQGNADATPASYTWSVDHTAPDTSIGGTHPSDPTNSGTATFSFSGTDDSGVASFKCKLDAGSFSTSTSPKSYFVPSEGSHTFQVEAIDGAGNADATPASFTWTIDTTDPVPSIDSSPTSPSGSADAAFTFSANEA